MRALSVLPCCALALPVLAAAPWPKDWPKPPVNHVSTKDVVDLSLNGVTQAGQLASAWSRNPKIESAYRLASAGLDMPEIKATWSRGERAKAACMLSWTMVKLGCPVADAVDFAGKVVGTGALAGRDAVSGVQLEEVYRSYKAAGGGESASWGVRQGFLSRELRAEMRKRLKGVTEEDLDRMERSALRTYCENRLYRERFDACKQQTRQWLQGQGIRWSGDETALEKFLAVMDEAERLIQSKGALAGLFDGERAKLARALLQGGRAGLDKALAEYFSKYFGDQRDARGNKTGGAPAPAAPGRPQAPQPQAPASQARGVWVRVDVVKKTEVNRPERVKSHKLEEGCFTLVWKPKGAQDFETTTFTWTPPPATLAPGTVTLSAPSSTMKVDWQGGRGSLGIVSQKSGAPVEIPRGTPGQKLWISVDVGTAQAAWGVWSYTYEFR